MDTLPYISFLGTIGQRHNVEQKYNPVIQLLSASNSLYSFIVRWHQYTLQLQTVRQILCYEHLQATSAGMVFPLRGDYCGVVEDYIRHGYRFRCRIGAIDNWYRNPLDSMRES